MEIIKFEKEEVYIEDFLNIPKNLYDKKTLMQNREEEKSLLLGIHPLSKYFKLNKFLVYKEGKAVGRFIITTYENDDTAYVGFFECINEKTVSDIMFNKVKEFSKEQGYKKIIGPVDASFWVKYRLKTNNFDQKPYTGEPCNKDYYYKMFLDNEFILNKRYISNRYNHFSLIKFKQLEFEKRYKQFTEKGYTFTSPTKNTFDKCFREIYQMIIKLYNDFPVYKYIEEEDFVKQFSFFKYIVDHSFIKLVYKNQKLVAFLIGIPDYNNMLYKKLKVTDYIKILWKRNVRSSNYVMLYMGVDKEHPGLARAMTYTIMQKLKRRQSTSIGALIKDTNINKNYGKKDVNSEYEYVLLEYSL